MANINVSNMNNITFKNTTANQTCPLCKIIYNGTNVWEKHNPGNWITTVAHTNQAGANGTRIKRCTRCNIQTTQDSIPHDWNYSYNNVATLAADGSYNKTCSLCSRNESGSSKGGFVINVNRGNTSYYWHIEEPGRIYLNKPYTSVGTLNTTIRFGVSAQLRRSSLNSQDWRFVDMPSTGLPVGADCDSDIVLASANFNSYIDNIQGLIATGYLLWTITTLSNVTVNRTYNITLTT